jgi:hypothetical protein
VLTSKDRGDNTIGFLRQISEPISASRISKNRLLKRLAGSRVIGQERRAKKARLIIL